MDKLDTIAAAAIAVLLAAALYLAVTAPPPAANHDADAARARALAARLEADLAKRTVRIKKVMNGGDLGQAQAMANDLAKAFPFAGAPHMLLGDIALRRQDTVAAMREYRLAVDRNPDYLDKKTRAFQGRKIRQVVEEAQEIVNKGLAEHPDDPALRRDKKTAYYLLRKLAGGCE